MSTHSHPQPRGASRLCCPSLNLPFWASSCKWSRSSLLCLDSLPLTNVSAMVLEYVTVFKFIIIACVSTSFFINCSLAFYYEVKPLKGIWMFLVFGYYEQCYKNICRSVEKHFLAILPKGIPFSPKCFFKMLSISFRTIIT